MSQIVINPKKRRLTSSNDSIPQSKRRKLNSLQNASNQFCKNKLFSNYLDQCQYDMLFKCLHNELNIRSFMAKIIAELAVGQIKYCENYSNCGVDICILHEHNTMNNSLLDYNRYIDTNTNKESLFCQPCSSELSYCTVNEYNNVCNVPFVKHKDSKFCDCGILISPTCYTHKAVCKVCNVEICSATQCVYHFELLCAECNILVCMVDQKQRKCSECAKYVCTSCIMSFDCGNIEHIQHWYHGNCNGNIVKCAECNSLFCEENSVRIDSSCDGCLENICDNCIEWLECEHYDHWCHGNCVGSMVYCVGCNIGLCPDGLNMCNLCSEYICNGCSKYKQCKHRNYCGDARMETHMRSL
eukprot:496035_1